ncbi:LytR/AlgR family response regulator transcription factor [Neptunicella marina]|uniref:Response regulator transcription factor n=1 Tax=Neptunicella marina TaxID=2125989 RepID=A0A8J6IW37_9ALTE|nr:LytTR family DNA-binding domain-containing protein [Neptunicella marina]MBC3766907.1 response regulator transcription factor [Neptunicella marina]
MIKVLVADDETLARQTIVLLLNQLNESLDIIQAEDGNKALAAFEKYQPDIAFLDIQMPGQTGIQLAEKIIHHSEVVFVTAYDQYAINAFELNAIDYLLKPFDDERFTATWQKVKRRLHEKNEHAHQPAELVELMKHLLSEQESQFKSRLVVKDPGRIRLIDVSEIEYIVGAGNYAEVHLSDGRKVLHRETLTTLERQLDPHEFIRIHRSSIVRRTFVSELRPNEKGDYSVILKNGDSLTLSRRNRHKLDELLN